MCGGESADQQTRFRQDLHLWWYHGCWSLHTGKCEKYIEHICTRLFQLWSRSNKNNIKSSSFRSHGAPLNSDSRLYCRLLKMALLLLCFFFFLIWASTHLEFLFHYPCWCCQSEVLYILPLWPCARSNKGHDQYTLLRSRVACVRCYGYALKWATKSYASLWPFRSFYDEQFFYNIDVAKQRDMIKKTFFEHVLFHWTVNVQ